MEMGIEVSIVVPVYNVAPWLERCLSSLSRQTCAQIEIICIDDGSTDESLAILETYGSREPRLRVLKQPNSGVSTARNRGIEHARGRYIAFVDADDTVEEDMIEKLLLGMVNTDADFAVCGYWDCDENDVKQHFQRPTRLDRVMEGVHDLTGMNIARRIPFACMKLYDAAIIRNNNILFDASIAIGEDYVFDLNYLMYARKGYFVNEGLYHYCPRLSSCIGSSSAGTLPVIKYRKMLEGRLKQFAVIPACPAALSVSEWRVQVFCGVAEAFKILLHAWKRNRKMGISILLFGLKSVALAFAQAPKWKSLCLVWRMSIAKRV